MQQTKKEFTDVCEACKNRNIYLGPKISEIPDKCRVFQI